MGYQKTYHETNEELESGSLELRDESSTVPEDESNDEEDQRLGEGEEAIAPDGSAVRLPEGFLQALAVKLQAVFLASEGGDGTDGASSLASELSRGFVFLFVRLILEHDHPETDVSRRDEQRSAGNSDESDPPDEDETKDGSGNESRDTLDDGTESDSGKTVDLLGIVAERRSQRSSLQ